MFDWFVRMMKNADVLGPSWSESSVQECPERPTLRIVGREREFHDEPVDLKLIGRPFDGTGEFRWRVDYGLGRIEETGRDRVRVRASEPGKLVIQAFYIRHGVSSQPAYHTIRFLAHPIYVVGGGAAGLKAAEHLLAQGYKVVLCEATKRLGGRARTETANTDAFPVDLGCQWLHGGEWRWELGQQGMPDLGFRIDDQRRAYPTLVGVWPWAEDVSVVMSAAAQAVERALESEFDDQPAEAHVPRFDAQEEFPKDDMKEVYEKRRVLEVRHGVELEVGRMRPKHEEQARSGLRSEEVLERATVLARSVYVGKVNPDDYTAQAEETVPKETKARAARLKGLRVQLAKAEETKRGLAFDTGEVLDKDSRVEDQMPKAEHELIEEGATQLGKQLHLDEKLVKRLEGDFDEARRRAFRDLLARAYETARAAEGPLEEAAEWSQFANWDRGKQAKLGRKTEEGAGSISAGDNAWYLGGYGGLIAEYGKYLQQKYPAKLRVRKGTAVRRVVYGGALPELTIDAGSYTTTEKASAVIVTVSTGVVNSGKLKFSGPKSKEVAAAYAKLPMGNYKKIVFVLDREVALPQVADAQGDSSTHRGTSVYWHLDAKGGLWKFLVPDLNRRIVITIVGGALADLLDKDSNVLQTTMAQAQVCGLLSGQEMVVEEFVSKWKLEPEFLGAYSYTAPGGKGARAALIAQPLGDSGVFLAGEALFVKYGTAHGAYITGLRAAKGVCKALSRIGFDIATYMD